MYCGCLKVLRDAFVEQEEEAGKRLKLSSSASQTMKFT